MSIDRLGARDKDTRSALNARWVANNPLTSARDRNRLGDTNINFDNHALQPMIPPMVDPMVPAIVPPMVRKMGEDAI